MSSKFYLKDNWKFKISSGEIEHKRFEEWRNAEVPGTIHTDLLKHKLIEEPFYDDNELKLEWIALNDWIYKTVFDLPINFNKNQPIILAFDGLDTVAEIKLNGSLIGTTDSMFLKYEFDVSKILKDSGNELLIHFESPTNYSKNLEKKFSKLDVALKSERVYIRKAQYSFEWDWGPSFPTMGIWKNVYLLQQEKIFIKSFNFSTLLISKDYAEVEALFHLGGNFQNNFKINIKISCEDDLIEHEAETNANDEIKLKIIIPNPKIWWPNGEGLQSLYNLEAVVKDEDENVLEKFSKKVGIRKIELRLKEDNKNTFKFIINGREVYAKGVNWIPADSFLPRITNKKYEQLLRFAKDGNMNMVRVWGGGIYENDIFYELCDELGLMVWQDFMFACACYPEYKEFLDSVKKEVEQNVKRLRHHASIVIWCGNNENEWIWYQNQKVSYKKMDGYKIYSEIIPEILNELDPQRPYWESSPFGFDEDPNSPNSGNRHEWGIWSMWTDYSEVKKDKSLFVTEFGFQGTADKKTFEKYLSKNHHHIQDSVFEFHNKQVEGPERIFKFLSGHLPVDMKWENFIYLSQLNQGFALKTCLEHWRTNGITYGSLIWQLNDCWPVTSWALIDSELRPKISYYFVKNIFSPQIISFKDERDYITINFLNQDDKIFNGKIEINFFNDLDGKAILNEEYLISKEKGINKIRDIYLNKIPSNKWTAVVSLFSEKNEIIFRNYFTRDKWKHKNLPAADLKIETDQDEMRISTDKPAFFVDLSHPDIDFEDKGFILLPGEEKRLKIFTNSFNQNDLQIISLNNFLSKH
jgi:beta-mannosidase